MSSRVTYNANTAQGRALAEFVDHLIEARALGARLKDALESMAEDTGSGPTWGQIDTELGAAGQGQTIYNIVAGVMTRLNSTEVALCKRLDQG